MLLSLFQLNLASGGGGGAPSSWPVAANWLLTATRAPLVGDFNVVTPLTREPFTIDFASQIPAGDSVSAAGASSLAAYYGADSNASALLWGSAAINGTKVTQWAGPGWLPAVIYRLTLNLTTVSGAQIALYAHIACQAIN